MASKPTGNPIGRPPALTEEDLEKIVKAAELGLSDKQLATIWGVTEQTLNNYKTQYPDFFESLKQAKINYDLDVVKSLRERAIGYSHKEVKHFIIKNRIIEKEVTKHYPPDATSLIFWLKNRLPEQFREKQEIEHKGDVININYSADKGDVETF